MNWDDFLASTDHEPPLADSERFVSYQLEDLRPEWQSGARCLGVGNERFFGNEEEQPTMSIAAIRRASKLCDVCPVYQECLRWALENKEEYGVWAGTSGRVRRKIQRMLDAGETSVDVVVEDFAHGRREQYAERPARRVGTGHRGRGRAVEGGSRLRDEAVG